MKKEYKVLTASKNNKFDDINDIDLSLSLAKYVIDENYRSLTSFSTLPRDYENLLWLMTNTVLYFRPVITTLTENGFVYRDLFDDDDALADHNPFIGSVLTSSKYINGAALMLIPHVRQRIAELLDGSFYFCFTSVNEAMIHKCVPYIKPEPIKEVILAMHESRTVDKELILSDHVYICDKNMCCDIDIVL